VVEEETDSVALLDAPDELMKRRHCPVGQRAEKWQEEEIEGQDSGKAGKAGGKGKRLKPLLILMRRI